MNKDALEKIEMKNDGHDAERFEVVMRKILKVSKKELQEREKAEKETNAKKKNGVTA